MAKGLYGSKTEGQGATVSRTVAYPEMTLEFYKNILQIRMQVDPQRNRACIIELLGVNISVENSAKKIGVIIAGLVISE